MTINAPPNATASVLATSRAVEAEPLELRESAAEEFDDIVELPTIQLTDFDEEMGAVNTGIDSGAFTKAVTAEHIPTFESSRDVDVDGGKSTRKMDYSDNRAEFISVSFWKDHPNVPLGINLMRGRARIASLSEGSMAHDSPLRSGDKILSVNNRDCDSSNLNGMAVALMLVESFGDVTLVIHNEGGASDLVESMVMKSEPNQKVGISVRQDVARSGTVSVGTITPNSKFSNSLLNAGDTVLSVNGAAVTHVDATTVANMIKMSPVRVTILGRTLRETGVVVAQLSERHVASSNLPVIAAAPTNPPIMATQRTQEQTWWNKLDDTERAACKFVFGLVCIGIIVAVVFAAVIK